MRVLVGYWLINILPLVSRETKKANLPTIEISWLFFASVWMTMLTFMWLPAVWMTMLSFSCGCLLLNENRINTHITYISYVFGYHTPLHS